MNELQSLLDKLSVISFKFAKLNEEEQFNIFPLLRNVSDEVNLHSQMLYALLKPNGSHGQGTKFLKEFVNVLEVDFTVTESTQIHKEYKNIDLLIKDKKSAIVIENKIWAEDQDRQLERYYVLIKGEGYEHIHLIYLTLDGHQPSELSLGSLPLDDVKLISYHGEINPWLEECIQLSSRNPALRETLIQYQKVIHQLTGNTMSDEQKMEVVELLSQNDNMLQAKLIADNWVHVKWHTEWDFWTDLEKLVTTKFKVLEHQKYSEENLSSVYHWSRGKNPWYGLMFKIGELLDTNVCLFIERGTNELYFGITMLLKGDRLITNDKIFDEYDKFLREHLIDAEERESQWLAWYYLSPYINFNAFSDENTLMLANKKHREKYLQDNWKEILKFIDVAQDGIVSLGGKKESID